MIIVFAEILFIQTAEFINEPNT